MARTRWVARLVTVTVMVAAMTAAACSPTSTKDKEMTTLPTEQPASSAPATTDGSPADEGVAEPAQPTENSVETISLSGDEPTPVGETGLRAHISGSFHKVRAPLVGVSVLVSASGQQAEVSWRIESGQLDSSWMAIEGRRYDEQTQTYVDEKLEGWQVRLDSVDAESAGGDPKAITISFRRVP